MSHKGGKYARTPVNPIPTNWTTNKAVPVVTDMSRNLNQSTKFGVKVTDLALSSSVYEACRLISLPKSTKFQERFESRWM